MDAEPRSGIDYLSIAFWTYRPIPGIAYVFKFWYQPGLGIGSFKKLSYQCGLGIKVIRKVTFSFTPYPLCFHPYPLLQWYPQSKKILLNLSMKCWNSALMHNVWE
jgi:hypothetical protein